MKISKVLFALIGCQHSTTALPLSDELKTLSNFDFWANSVTSQVPFGKAASLGVPHTELPFVIYRLLKKSNVWASRHLLVQAQERFDTQSYDMESETVMLMSDLINQERIQEGRVARILGRSQSLAAKGDELAELIVAWDMAAHSITLNKSDVINLDSKRTEDAAGRLRGIRADLFQLLNGMPDSYFEENEQQDGSGASGDYEYTAVYDDKDDDTVELVFDNNTGTFDDVAILVRNGALDESLLKTGNMVNSNMVTLEESDEENSRGLGLFQKDSDETVHDMPTFEKYMAGNRQREPRLINGQNENSDNNWLGYSLLGSIGAIFVTVSATVCVRRVKSKKDETSGTPIQKLKRYQGHQVNQVNQNRPGRSLNHVDFTGYNPAFRPQYFNPNQSANGGFSSLSSSGSSGFGMPNQIARQPVSGHFNQPNSHLARAMSMSSGHTSENRSQAPLTSSNPQDRALPRPPYAKVQY